MSLGVGWDCEIGADGGDGAVLADEDDLVGEEAGVVDVDEFASANGDGDGRRLLLRLKSEG